MAAMAREAGKVRARSASKMRGTGRADKGQNKKKAPAELTARVAAGEEGEAEAEFNAAYNSQDVRKAAERVYMEADGGNSQKYWGIVLLFAAVPFFLFCLCAPDKVGIALSPISAYMQYLVESVTIIGVNVFVLLSGWYGIKCSLRKILYIIFQSFQKWPLYLIFYFLLNIFH